MVINRNLIMVAGSRIWVRKIFLSIKKEGDRMEKQFILSNLHNETQAVKEAVAFYTAFSVTATNCTVAERERHYDTLEQVGYIEKLGALS